MIAGTGMNLRGTGGCTAEVPPRVHLVVYHVVGYYVTRERASCGIL